jgi:hypothetical protein
VRIHKTSSMVFHNSFVTKIFKVGIHEMFLRRNVFTILSENSLKNVSYYFKNFLKYIIKRICEYIPRRDMNYVG